MGKHTFSLSNSETPEAKADTIAHRMKRTLNERMDEDPALHKKFSQLVGDTIEAFQQNRISEVE